MFDVYALTIGVPYLDKRELVSALSDDLKPHRTLKNALAVFVSDHNPYQGKRALMHGIVSCPSHQEVIPPLQFNGQFSSLFCDGFDGINSIGHTPRVGIFQVEPLAVPDGVPSLVFPFFRAPIKDPIFSSSGNGDQILMRDNLSQKRSPHPRCYRRHKRRSDWHRQTHRWSSVRQSVGRGHLWLSHRF